MTISSTAHVDIFNYLKTRVSIVDVISEHTTLKKAGLYLKGRCPFHHEKTASFTVSPHIDIFYCFGCHETGDVIAFIAKAEHCTPLQAVHYLADRYNIELPQHTGFGHQADKKVEYVTVCTLFAQWAHAQLSKHPYVQRYLVTRGLQQKSIQDFTIGYVNGGLHSIKQLVADMHAKNILLEDLMSANIVSAAKKVLYSPYEDRIIFPIKDQLGKVCGFGGRTFKDNDTRPKYYNSKENEFFAKGSLLFGFDSAKKTIQEANNVFLVEGYTDCIAMVQSGYRNTVATLGTACTLAHIKLLSRYCHHVSIVYDSDTAGRQAILRMTELCWQADIELYVITLPQGYDPASFLAQGNDLAPYIAKAQDIFLFFIESLGTNFAAKPLYEKMHVARSLIDTISMVEEPIKQDILLQKAAEYLHIDITSLKKELLRTSTATKHSAVPASHAAYDLAVQPSDTKEEELFSGLEKKIFSAIINNIQLFNKKDICGIIDYLPSTLRTLLLHLKTGEATRESIGTLLTSMDDTYKRIFAQLLLDQKEEIDEPTFDELVNQLRKKWWKTITRNIKDHIAHAKREMNEEKVQELLKNFMLLQDKVMRTNVKKLSHNDT